VEALGTAVSTIHGTSPTGYNTVLWSQSFLNCNCKKCILPLHNYLQGTVCLVSFFSWFGTILHTISLPWGGGGKVARIRRYFYTCPLDYAKWATFCGRLNSSRARCSDGRPL
jgi:hypothetical protein